LEPDGIRSGEFFLEELFQELGRGSSFADSFNLATNKTEVFTRRGGSLVANALNRFFDQASQHPLLDDDGDGLGSNLLNVESGDGALAHALLLGIGPNFNTNSAENPADVVDIPPTLFVTSDASSAALYLRANNNSEVSQAYVEIREPAKELFAENGTEQLEADFERSQLLPPGNAANPFPDHFFTLFTDLVVSGKYEIFYFVEDAETGNISPSKRSVVYKDKGDNTPPGAFDLLTPGNNATEKTIMTFDWEDATADTMGSDPTDSIGVTYTMTIATDPEMTDIIFMVEELTSSATVVDDSAGLRDLTNYYWQVEAIDGFGARTLGSNGPLLFTTDNQNNIPGIILGLVHSDVSFARLTGAMVSVPGIDPVMTDSNGAFFLLVDSGTVIVSSSHDGFDDAVVSNVEVLPGKTTEGFTIGMSPDQSIQADVSITVSNASDIILGENVIYNVTVTNAGPTTANNVIISQGLPGTALFVSAPGCTGPVTNTVTCLVDSLAIGTQANFTVTVNPQTDGSATSSLAVIANEFDQDNTNNTVEVHTEVDDPDKDSDGDGFIDTTDNCVFDSNADQLDTDTDGEGDVCDSDDDGDGILDINDAFPLDNTENIDTDNDGTGNNSDNDDDNDGLTDTDELNLGTNPLKADSDGDGISDGDEVIQGRNPNIDEKLIILLINSFSDG
jgi:uncharacterized repeat protein (TIGR01451 family)